MTTTHTAPATTDRSRYGAVELNGLVDPEAYLATIDFSQIVEFNNPALVKIIRLRLLSDPGFPFWDVSYCHGELADGTRVRVQLPIHQFRKPELSRQLVDMARNAGRYAKGMGLLDAVSICY